MLQRLIMIAAAAVFSSSVCAAEVNDLYDAQAIVTGTEEPERTRGFRTALIDVIIKVTGDARLEQNGKLQPLLNMPHRFVERFEYEDRMKDIPVHDEQGTRERPHFLRVRFKTPEIDRELQTLGLRKWLSDRPVLIVWLGVSTARGTYVLEADGPNGYGQRTVMVETATRRGLPIALPPPGQKNITFDDISSMSRSKLKTAAPDADAVLIGMLSITGTGYWDTDWYLSYRNQSRSWALRNVSFDTALKNGLQTSALIFSGNAPM